MAWQRRVLYYEDVHEITGIPVNTLRYWRVKKVGPPTYKIGNRVAYDPVKLREWLDAQRGAES